MLVLDPMRRYSIDQIKRHRWMMAESAEIPLCQPIGPSCGTSAYEPNEQILRLMANLGIDSQKTRDSLKTNSYDHHAAIYLLLMERLKHRSMSQDGGAVVGGGSGHSGIKHPSLESQKRRPSSIAEQAMRKLGLTHQRSMDPSISPRHHTSITVDRSMDSGLPPQLQTPLMPIGPLRESNIREQPQLRESSFFAPNSFRNYNTAGLNSNLFLNREREYISSSGAHGGSMYPASATPIHQSSIAGIAKESSTALIQKEIQSGISALGISHRAPSNRLLASGLDQRIMKQSSEDCRRLLQQVRWRDSAKKGGNKKKGS